MKMSVPRTIPAQNTAIQLCSHLPSFAHKTLSHLRRNPRQRGNTKEMRTYRQNVSVSVCVLRALRSARRMVTCVEPALRQAQRSQPCVLSLHSWQALPPWLAASAESSCPPSTGCGAMVPLSGRMRFLAPTFHSGVARAWRQCRSKCGVCVPDCRIVAAMSCGCEAWRMHPPSCREGDGVNLWAVVFALALKGCVGQEG